MTSRDAWLSGLITTGRVVLTLVGLGVQIIVGAAKLRHEAVISTASDGPVGPPDADDGT